MAIERLITIIGCGPGAADYVTPAARAAARDAQVLAGSKRLLELFADAPGERLVVGADIEALLGQLASLHAAGRRIAVLVSGDPGVFSLAKNVIARFGRDNCRVIPGVSSVQVAFARLGLEWWDARIISAHASIPHMPAEELAREDKIAVLAGTADAIAWCAELAAQLASTHVAFLAEDLTLPTERFAAFVRAFVRSSSFSLSSPAPGASSLSIILLIRKELLA